jgi:hypothetical protein
VPQPLLDILIILAAAAISASYERHYALATARRATRR